ncbi:MAG: winged helix-turn-helix transcriptional regulator [Aeromicrobium sp.]
MRSYDQYCGLAGALDLIGERWTLLVIRELATGPKRYTDLAENLPGIGTSLLAQRLKALEDHDVIGRRTLPPPAGSTVYELSSIGLELSDALVPLIRWGLTHALPPQPRASHHIRAEWSLLAFAQLPEAALAGIDASYRVEVSGKPAILRIHGSRAEILPEGAIESPDAVLRFDADVVSAIGSGRLTAGAALASGRITTEGDALAAGALITAIDAR